MPTPCFALMRGKVARFTLLDVKGYPVEGPRSTVITSGVTSVTLAEIADTRRGGVERGYADRICLRRPDKTTFLGYSGDLRLIGTDPDLIEFLTGQMVVENSLGARVGNDVKSNRTPVNFALEVWSKLAQPVDDYDFGLTTFPHLRGGRVTGFQFGARGTVSFSVTGFRSVPSARWGKGPYDEGWDVLPWDVGGWDAGPVAGSEMSRRAVARIALTRGAPEPSCGSQPLILPVPM